MQIKNVNLCNAKLKGVFYIKSNIKQLFRNIILPNDNIYFLHYVSDKN